MDDDGKFLNYNPKGGSEATWMFGLMIIWDGALISEGMVFDSKPNLYKWAFWTVLGRGFFFPEKQSKYKQIDHYISKKGIPQGKFGKKRLKKPKLKPPFRLQSKAT